MTTYPVTFGVALPDRFDRVQIVIRIVLLAVLSMLGVSLGALTGVLYLVLPLIAALAISQKGAERFLREDAPRITRALGWFFEVAAYLYLLTDRLPGSDGEDRPVRFAVQPRGEPTAGSALLRLLTSVPSALVLVILHLVAWVVWLIAALLVLVSSSYPAALADFQCGVLRWQARLFVYHASLVEAYPPFEFAAGTAAPRSEANTVA